jgi:hypothetical protein
LPSSSQGHFKSLCMKIVAILCLLVCNPMLLWAQVFPEQNADSLVSKLKVKSIETYFTDRSSGKNHLIQSIAFNEKGQRVYAYALSLWEVVSYSYTTNFKYDDQGQLVEKVKLQKVLSIFPRDDEYINSFGDMPVNEQTFFEYDDNEHLIKKDIYVFHTNELPIDTIPSQTIRYTYEDGKLVRESSTSRQRRIFNKNYEILFQYDSAGHLIERVRNYGDNLALSREIKYRYDLNGRMAEKVVFDKAAPHNNVHEKYDYDTTGRISALYIFSDELQDFEMETTYKYDAFGKQIAGDRDVQFEYHPNGLIKSESWQDPLSGQQITFSSEYEYY